MPEQYELPFRTKPATPRDLRNPGGMDLCALAASDEIPYVRLCGCLAGDGGQEAVVIEVDVERPQRVIHDIRCVEQLAVVFPKDEKVLPEVFALRRDFPSVPHLNLRQTDYPKSLCLFDEPPEAIRLRWTALFLVERVRQWLALTAQGKLHQDDQPLEPLMLSAGMTLVLPSDWKSKAAEAGALLVDIHRTSNVPGRTVFVATSAHVTPDAKRQPAHAAMWIVLPPRVHGVIRQQPRTLKELAQLVDTPECELLNCIRKGLLGWQLQDVLHKKYDTQFILILSLPKKRTESAQPESYETWAFLCLKTVAHVGADIGVWQKTGDQLGPLIRPDESMEGANTEILPMRTTFALSRKAAAECNGIDPRYGGKMTLIGLGALGSQTFMNLVRAGFGEWTVVDEDIVLPHNLARHALHGSAVGFPKAQCMEVTANATIDGDPIARSIVADVLRPGDAAGELNAALEESSVIVDASVSVPVARYLARDVNSDARRVSVFLNPSGTACVALAEPPDRAVKLDSMEMQYYGFLANAPEMRNHFDRPGPRQRYGNSCRDISFQLSQELLSVHAGICSRAIRNAVSADTGSAHIWSVDASDMTVTKHDIAICRTVEWQMHEWTIQTDEGLLDRLHSARKAHLPNETGGVLLGAYDMQRKVLYVVDTILSPPDSEEWPTVYIRGCKGLRKAVRDVERHTDGNLAYIGEWHSHPRGCGCSPSPDDMTAFAWLTGHMTAIGLPPLMAIIGSRGSHGFYLVEMPERRSRTQKKNGPRKRREVKNGKE